MTGRWHALIFTALLFTSLVAEAAFVIKGCRPMAAVKQLELGEVRHARGILWRLSRAGIEDSFLFGTIHLADAEVTALPTAVTDILDQADSFVMEALLDDDSLYDFTRMFFYEDGTRLSSMMSEVLFNRAVKYLSAFGYTAQVVDRMKPWAAYLVLNGPRPGSGVPLDMLLLKRARQNGAVVYGLETLKEQGQVLEDMTRRDQLSLLRDSLCHYNRLRDDIEEMKGLYLQRDLAGLLAFAGKYIEGKDRSYARLMDALLWRRNLRMVKRIKPMLVDGNNFIAVGALHLPGKRGLLRLLEKMGYEVNVVY